jgi:hypothetical protein
MDHRSSRDVVRVTGHLIQIKYGAHAGIQDVEGRAPLIPGALRYGMADQIPLLRPPSRVVQILQFLCLLQTEST